MEKQMLLLLEGVIKEGILLQGSLKGQRRMVLFGVYAIHKEHDKWVATCWHTANIYHLYPRLICRLTFEELKKMELARALAMKK